MERQLQVPPAPPLLGSAPPDIPPPPPPVGDEQPFPRRRDILGALLLGTGLWWLRLADQRPDVQFRRTKAGTPYMVSGTGDVFVLASVPRGPGQEPHIIMIDLNGNMYFDTDDPRLGMYIVDQQRGVVNAYMTPGGEVAVERIGSLEDLAPIKIASMGNVKMDGDGQVVWAFVDSEEPLVISPESFLQKDENGKQILAYPTEIDEGVIRVTEARKQMFNFFGNKEGGFGGPLQRDTP